MTRPLRLVVGAPRFKVDVLLHLMKVPLLLLHVLAVLLLLLLVKVVVVLLLLLHVVVLSLDVVLPLDEVVLPNIVHDLLLSPAYIQ